MKPLLALVLAAFIPVANAQATNFYCDTALTVAGSCDIYVDALPKVNAPTVLVGSIHTCKYDITSLAVGAHTLTCAAVSVAADPTWGAQTSAKASPALPYTKYGLLMPPTNLRTGP